MFPQTQISRIPVLATDSANRVLEFFKDPLPNADAITMGMILRDWNLEKKMHFIRAAYDALPPGGAFVAIEALIDDARRGNVQGLLMSSNMLIEFGDAADSGVTLNARSAWRTGGYSGNARAKESGGQHDTA